MENYVIDFTPSRKELFVEVSPHFQPISPLLILVQFFHR